jgi:hypothetical protein
MDFSKLFASYKREEIIAAIYFCTRELKQSYLSAEKRKEHHEDGRQSKPSERVVELSNQITAAIEKQEGKSLANFPDEVAQRYIDSLFEQADRLNEATAEEKDRGKVLLENLRAGKR